MKNLKPKLIYIIGPNFCVHSLAAESLKMLSLKYRILCISEGPLIKNPNFDHKTICFTREPSIINDLKCLFQLVKIISKNKDASKIVISTPKISFLAALACKFNQKKYIYLHRGSVYQNFTGLKFFIYKHIDKIVIKGSENTTFISSSLHNWVTKTLNLGHIKYFRKYNSSKGVDLDKFTPRLSKKDSEKTVIGFCGRIVRDKGFEELVKLAEMFMHDPNILIKIKGKIELNKEDKKVFHKITSNNSIQFLEWDDDVAGFFQSIDILFFPSKREGFGNVLIEAAACGVPSLGYRIPGVSDAISDMKSGFLAEPDSDILNAMKRIINNKQDLLALSASARRVAETKFNQELVLEDIHLSMGL